MNQNILSNLMKSANKENILSRYNDLIASKIIKEDEEQYKVAQALHDLQTNIDNNLKSNKSKIFGKILSSNNENNIKGLYLWGGVGRGKSMLMDLFFESSNIEKKRRVHFHSFMLEIHRKIHKWRQQENNSDTDPIIPLAKTISDNTILLCFDEFQVSDIADAMILGKLFYQLFKNGVIIVATSNRPINDLYKDGLQRERFVPFLTLFQNKMIETELDSPKDYRLLQIKALETCYRYPLDIDSSDFLNDTFRKLTNNNTPETKELKIGGRTLTFNNSYLGVLLTSFHELCEQPLGAQDYIEIAREFNTVLIANIPKLSAENRNEAKRFVTLIDELYEHNVKLICTADSAPEDLYKEGHGAFEFDRTVSRLKEMQSNNYIKKKHLS